MSSVEIKAAISNQASGFNPVTIYTVPAGKQAIVRAVNIVNTAQENVSIAPAVAIRRSGTVTRISTAAIALGATANMLTAALTMISGDELVTTETSSDTLGIPVGFIFPDGNSSAPVAIVDDNIIICCNGNGIFRSTDAGVTFTAVSSLTCSTNIAAAKIGTDYFIYQSRTSAYRSTDSGLTWTTQAVTNAPNAVGGTGLLISTPGRIVFNGTVYGCLTTSTQLATTTDGITWTPAVTSIPSGSNSLVWSGTHWVAGSTTATPNAHRSTDGVSWTTALTRTASGTVGTGGLATDGAGVLITGNPAGTGIFGRSTDHGATWSDQTAPFTFSGSTNLSSVYYIGSNFVVFNASGISYYSPTGITGSFLNTNALSIWSDSSSSSYGVNATNVFYTQRGLRTFTLTIPTVYSGMGVAASILEVTP